MFPIEPLKMEIKKLFVHFYLQIVCGSVAIKKKLNKTEVIVKCRLVDEINYIVKCRLVHEINYIVKCRLVDEINYIVKCRLVHEINYKSK